MRFSRTIIVVLVLLAAGPVQAQDGEDGYRDARRALNRQRFDEAIAAFQALRSDYPDSQYAADSYYWEAFALERNGNPERAVQVLDTLLREHRNASTVEDARALRIRICSELAQRGDGECAATISSIMRDPAQLDDATRMAAVKALITMRADRAVPIATQLLENRNQAVAVRKQALFVVADKAVEAQAREVLLNVALDQTDDPDVRAQAVFWLSEVPGEETLRALSGLLDGPADHELKNRAIFAISQHESPQAMSLLREFAENDDLDIGLRKQAIFWIGDRGEQQALPFLEQLYANLTDSALKQQVLFAVSETDADDSTDWLVSRARDEAEPIEVRKQALFWAADSGLPSSELVSLYQSFSERPLREHLIWLMADHDDEGALDSLLEIARNDPDPDLRAKAVFWLGDSDDPRAAEYLIELLRP
jgi:HEAT repeat protein